MGGKSDYDNSFISTVPPGMHDLIQLNSNTPEEMKEERGVLTQQYTATSDRRLVMEFGDAANRVLRRRPKNQKRIVMSSFEKKNIII